MLSSNLLPQSLERNIGITLLLHDLAAGHLKVFLSDMYPTLSEGKHTGLGTDGLTLGTTGIEHLLGDDLEVDAADEIHLAGVDLHNGHTVLHVRVGELDLAIDTARSEEGGVEDIYTVRGHDDLDLLRRFETIELVEQLQHGTLDLGISRSAATGLADGVDLVHEDDRGGSLTGHDKQLTDHAGSLADVFLHKLSAGHTDEGTVGVMSDGTSEEGLTGTGRTVQEDTLGLSDAETVEQLGMLDGKLDNLLDLHHLLLETTDHVVGGIGHGLDLHETDEGIDLGREDLVQRVGIVPHGDTGVGLKVVDVDPLVEINDVFALGIDLDQDLLLTHLLDDLSDVRTRLLQMIQLLPKHPDLGIQLIPPGLEPLEISGSLLHSLLVGSVASGCRETTHNE